LDRIIKLIRMKLFLTSAGLPPGTTEEFLRLLNKKPEETKVCFVTTASNPEEDKWYVEKDRERLSEIGFKVTEFDLEGKNEASLRDNLKDFDVIYVEGGSTFYLLKYVRKSGFDKVLPEFLQEGGIYVGVSAGTIIVGLNIETSNWNYGYPDKNTVGLKDLTGLSLVPFVFCVHIDKKDINIIKESTDKTKYPTIGLADNQALLVEDGKKEIVGGGEKHIFNTDVQL